MRKIFLSSLLFLSVVSICQTETSTITEARKRQIEDSISAVLKNIEGNSNTISPIPYTDTVGQSENPGLDYFVKMQEREKADQKKTATVRIILGLLLLGILIIGLTRKVKKKVGE